MSLKDKFKAVNQGLGEGIGEAPRVMDERPKTAPGQMLMYSEMVREAQDKSGKLEQRLKELEQPLAVDAISPNPWQPRTAFDEAEIGALAQSIAEIGLIQPVVVRRKSVTSSDTFPKYELIAGERRLRAHQLLGMLEIKAAVVEAADSDMAVMALAENMDRQDLAEYEIAKAIRRAENEFPSRKKLAEAVGRTRQDLYKYLAFSELPGNIQQDLDRNPRALGRNAAELIVRLIKNHGDQAEAALQAIWPRVVSGDIDQSKAPSLIDAAINKKGAAAFAGRSIRKLFVGRLQAGSITRDASKLQITIKATALTPEVESKIREFVEQHFAAGIKAE